MPIFLGLVLVLGMISINDSLTSDFRVRERGQARGGIQSMALNRLGNLLIGQVAGRIRSPHIVCYRFRPNSEIPAADIQPAAGGAASFYMFFLVLQLAH